jgi:hypothetical protein
MIEKKFGIYPVLQETDVEDIDEEYQIYMHSDADELSEEEFQLLTNMGITEDPDASTEAIKKIFRLDFRVI